VPGRSPFYSSSGSISIRSSSQRGEMRSVRFLLLLLSRGECKGRTWVLPSFCLTPFTCMWKIKALSTHCGGTTIAPRRERTNSHSLSAVPCQRLGLPTAVPFLHPSIPQRNGPEGLEVRPGRCHAVQCCQPCICPRKQSPRSRIPSGQLLPASISEVRTGREQ